MDLHRWQSESEPGCLDPPTVLSFLAGTLAPELCQKLEAHVDVCEECRRVLAEMGRSPPAEIAAAAAAAAPEPPSGDAVDRVGSVLNDTYRLERLIGEGGMGRVYEATHLRVPRRLAVKLLHADVMAEPDAFARFQREAEIASALRHHNIVEVLDFNRAEDGTPYIVLELLEGEDLGHRLTRVGRLDIPDTRRVFQQLAAGLGVAHEHGIVHRDLKPNNVFLCNEDGRDDVVRVLDFGVSKLLGRKSETKSGAVFGTPRYMSPEQAHGRQNEVDARTDIFALGCMLYECVSGRPPFDAPSVPSLLHSICYDDPPAVTSLADVPAGIEQVIDTALAKRREDRYSTVRAFFTDLDVACRGASLRVARRRRRVGLTGGMVAAGLIGCAALVWLGWPAEAPSSDGGTSRPVAVAPPLPPPPPPVVAPSAAAVAQSPTAHAASHVTAATSHGVARRPSSAARRSVVAEVAPHRRHVPAAMSPATVTLRLALQPSDARVVLDGVPVEGTVIHLRRASGTHQLVVTAPGHEKVTRTVASKADIEIHIQLPMLPAAPVKAREPKLPGPMEDHL